MWLSAEALESSREERPVGPTLSQKVLRVQGTGTEVSVPREMEHQKVLSLYPVLGFHIQLRTENEPERLMQLDSPRPSSQRDPALTRAPTPGIDAVPDPPGTDALSE